MKHNKIVALVVAFVAAASLTVIGTVGAGAQGSVRGFDGNTIKVASFGASSILPGAGPGAEARINRFNEDNEIKGVKIDWLEYANDNRDPATALSEARRLVTQENVFAIVGDTSLVPPGDEYFIQQKVPFFGGGFTTAFCSEKPSTKVWGFGTFGCTAAADPKVANDRESLAFKYTVEKTGDKKPTAAMLSNDNETGKRLVPVGRSMLEGAGFKIVYQEAALPPEASDVSPFVQDLLTADNGKPPDYINCYAQVQCISIWSQLQASGYKGAFETQLYSDALVKPLAGTIAQAGTENLSASTPALNQLREDLAAVAPNQKLDTGVTFGYMSTDMFIQALKTVAKKGKANITPENVQKAAATQTWEMKGAAGPVEYPASTVHLVPSCTTLVESDGTAWQSKSEYTCTKKTYKVKQ